MFVGLMAKLNATSQRSNAQYAMMQNRMNMMNSLKNVPFAGMSMDELHQMDTNFALNNDYNQTMYLLASAQEKFAKQMLEQGIKDFKISYIA